MCVKLTGRKTPDYLLRVCILLHVCVCVCGGGGGGGWVHIYMLWSLVQSVAMFHDYQHSLLCVTLCRLFFEEPNCIPDSLLCLDFATVRSL